MPIRVIGEWVVVPLKSTGGWAFGVKYSFGIDEGVRPTGACSSPLVSSQGLGVGVDFL